MSTANPKRVRVAGADLAAHFASAGSLPHTLCVDPPPVDWAPIKPRLIDWLDAQSPAALAQLRIEGIPRCLMGSEHPRLPQSGAGGHALPGCSGCRLQPSCHPPRHWAPGMAPYAGDTIDERWARWYAIFRDRVWDPPAAITTKFEELRQFIFAVGARLASAPLTLEPSLVIRGAVLQPKLRFGLFHGRLPSERGRAEHDTSTLLHAANQLQLRAFDRCDFDFESLAELGPMCLPMGLEAEAEAIHLKWYLRLPDEGPAQRHSFIQHVEDLLGHPCAARERAADIDMLGIGLSERGLSSLKSYVRADPQHPDPTWALDPIPHAHPLLARCRGQAYAVLDATSSRGPKWDFNLRSQFLANAGLADELRPLLKGASEDLNAFAKAYATRMDCIAAGCREDAITLYLEIS